MDIDYFFVSRTAILLFCFLPSSVSLAFSGIFNSIPSGSFLEKKHPKALSQSFTAEAASVAKVADESTTAIVAFFMSLPTSFTLSEQFLNAQRAPNTKSENQPFRLGDIKFTKFLSFP